MSNRLAVVILVAVLLIAMAAIALMDNTPTAALSYNLGTDEFEKITNCQELGKTPWLASEDGKTIVRCDGE